MNARKLALISVAALGLALSSGARAAEADASKESHHEEAGNAATPEAEGEIMSGWADNDSDMMMMCEPMMSRVMSHMMGKGSTMSKMGMMGQGMRDRGMMHGGMMGGRSMMRGGMMVHGGFPKLLSVDDAKERLGEMIAHNKRLKVGKVEPAGDFTLAAEITTVDGSLVHKLL